MDYQVHLQKYAIAVKALIEVYSYYDDAPFRRLLVLTNSLNDPNRPGEADLPGGRLELGEDPYVGLKRELREELGKEIADTVQIGVPLDVGHFERPDGQVVTMIFFKCTISEQDFKDKQVVISPEHSKYEWVPTAKAEDAIHPKMLRAYQRLKDWGK